MANSDVLTRLVETFGVFDDRRVSREFDIVGDVVPVLDTPWDEDGWAQWSPVSTAVLPAALVEDLHGVIRGPLPPLYQQLILAYRWAEVDLGRLRLLANLPPGLQGLAGAIRRDEGLYSVLSSAGYVQFGKGPDMDYDPVCFDFQTRLPDGDCRIVKFDHEEILCHQRLVEVAELAPSFSRLIDIVIEDADRERAIKALGGAELEAAAGHLHELGSDTLSLLVAAFEREPDVALRHRFVHTAWQGRSSEAIPFLAMALNDHEPIVWKEALNGLMAPGAPNAEPLLLRAKAHAADLQQHYRRLPVRNLDGAYADRVIESSADKISWIDKSIQQIHDRKSL